MKTLFIIMGMHRSGTSLTAQLLTKMNVWMGDESQMLSKNQYNEKGYWELKELVQMDDLILAKSKSMWYSLKEPILDRELIQSLVSDFARKFLDNDIENIAIKDPRVTILWKPWIDAMENNERLIKGIVVVRNPFEVAKSLCERDGMQQEYALCLWYRYNWECLMFAKEYDAIWMDYDEYFCDFEGICKKIGEFIGTENYYNEAKLDDVVDKKIRHFKQQNEKKDSWIENAVQNLYESFQLLSKGCISVAEVVDKHLEEYQSIYQYGSGLIYHESIDEAAQRIFLYRVMGMLERNQFTNVIEQIINLSKPMVLCGNGKNLEKLLPLLENNNKNVIEIYDKYNKTEREFQSKRISICSLDELKENYSEKNYYLITPFYNNENEILRDLSEIIELENIHKLSDILLENY